MATQVLHQPAKVTENPTDALQDVPGPISGATSSALSTLDGLSSNIGTWAQDILDRFFPPEQRETLLSKIKAFVLANPKVSAFLGMNIALTGIPLGLFTLFGLSVAVFSVLGGIILGLLGAVFFTLFWVSVALIIVLPVLMFTTASACFLFLFGLGGYKILKWASGRDQDDSQANGDRNGTTMGDSLNSLTGGRLTGLLDDAKDQRQKEDIKGFSDEKTPARHPQAPKLSKAQPVQPAKKADASKATAPNMPQTALSPSVTKLTKSTPLNPIAPKKLADEKKVGVMADGE